MLCSNLLLLNGMCMLMYIGFFYFGFLIHEQLLILYKEIKYFNPTFNFFHIFLKGTCAGVLIFKIFVCSVLQLQRTIWTLDLKCSQQPKCKYLWPPLFWMPHACWVLYVGFFFFHVFLYSYCFVHNSYYNSSMWIEFHCQ